MTTYETRLNEMAERMAIFTFGLPYEQLNSKSKGIVSSCATTALSFGAECYKDGFDQSFEDITESELSTQFVEPTLEQHLITNGLKEPVK